MENPSNASPQGPEPAPPASLSELPPHRRPALVIGPIGPIIIQSWSTPLVGLLMLLLGALLGYASGTRPPAAAATGIRATDFPTLASASSASGTTQDQGAAIMALVVGKTRHFLGDAKAPVTMIEFGDFQ